MMKRAGQAGVHIPAYSAGLEKVQRKDNSQGQGILHINPGSPDLPPPPCTGGSELRHPQGSEQGSLRRASLDVHPISC